MPSLHYNLSRTNDLEYIPSPDLMIIRTEAPAEPESILVKAGYIRDIDYLPVDDYPEASAEVFRVMGPEPATSRDQIKATVRAMADVSLIYIGTILQRSDTGSYQIYTGNIYIQFTPETTSAFIQAIFSEYDLEEKRRLYMAEVAYFARFKDELELGRGIFDRCRQLLTLPNIISCYPEMVVKRKSLPNDAVRSLLSGIDPGWAASMIQLDIAWTLTRGKGSTICIIDDGIDLHHLAFQGDKIVETIDLLDTRQDASHKYMTEWHGTACASIAASRDDKAIGVAPEAKLMIARCKGLGSVHEAEAILWAADNGADIISCSWGPPDGQINDITDDAISYILPDHTRLALQKAATYGRNSKGCPIFFAAGNGAEPVKYDGYASNEFVMAIGAVNKEGYLTRYSDRGDPLFCCFPSSEVLLGRDGSITTIYGLSAADRLGPSGIDPGDYTNSFGGTSASAPGMAGVTALMLSVNPELSLTEIRNLLRQSCQKPAAPSGTRHGDYGSGIINAFQAVTRAQNTSSTYHKNNNNMDTSTVNRFAIHLALNEVDPSAYPQMPNTLFGCINDSNYYASLTSHFPEGQNFILHGTEATREQFREALLRVANLAQPEDVVIITYAGHGGFIEDFNGDESGTGDGRPFDETMVLYNGIWIDDETFALLAQFRPDVNIIFFFDSCHSGTASRAFNPAGQRSLLRTRETSLAVIRQAYEYNKKYYDQQWQAINRGQSRTNKAGVKARVICFAACTDTQLAQETDSSRGLFTWVLENSFDHSLTIQNFRTKLTGEMARLMVPEVQRPFFDQYGDNPSSLDTFTITALFGSSGTDSKSTNSNSSTNNQDASQMLGTLYHTGLLLTRDGAATNGTGQENRLQEVLIRHAAGRSLRAANHWDLAYETIASKTDFKAGDFAEPDLISIINTDPAEAIERSGDEYLATYPHPGPGDRRRISWHLDDEHSQLRSAALIACPELALDIPGDADTYPLIAHIDTGILPGHPSLPLHFDQIQSREFTDPTDRDIWYKFGGLEQQGHGQGTISLLAGRAWRNMALDSDEFRDTYLGAFPYARVISLRIGDSVALLSGKNFARAVDYAIRQKVDVITMSMAGAPSKLMVDAINRAYEAGIVVVSAGGNKWYKGLKKLLPDSLMYPAICRRVIAAVGVNYGHEPYQIKFDKATRDAGSPYMESCYGPKEAMQYALAAYTPNVVWTGTTSGKMFSRTGGGTSSATPQIAAAAALYIHHHRNYFSQLKPKEAWKKAEIVRQALFRGANKNTGYEKYFGQGILKAKFALELSPKVLEASITKPEADSIGRSGLDELVAMWFNASRSGAGAVSPDAKIQTICDMLALEIEQLIYTQTDLAEFAGQDGINSQLAEALCKNPLASGFLKTMMHLQLRNTFLAEPTRSADFSMLSAIHVPIHEVRTKEEGEYVRIWTNSLEYQISEVKKEPAEAAGQVIEMVKIELPDVPLTRGDLPADVQISHTLTNANAILHQVEYEDGEKIAFWNFEQKDQNNRGVGEQLILRPGEQIYSIHSEAGNARGRGFFKKIKQIVVAVVRTILDKPLAGDEGLYLISADDPKNPTLIKKEADLPALGNRKLLFLHGTWNQFSGSFADLIDDARFMASLKFTYGNYFLAYEMSTIRSSVFKNGNALKQHLEKKLKLNLSDIDVISSSRGCLVAKFVFTNANRMVLTAGPHFGTPLVEPDNIPGLVNRVTTLLSLINPLGPVTKAILSAVSFVLRVIVEAPGLADQREQSDLLQKDLKGWAFTANQLLIGNDYEPNTSFDDFFDDKIMFGLPNDFIIPIRSTLGVGSGSQKPPNYYFIEDKAINHFKYYSKISVKNKILEHLGCQQLP